MNAKTNRTIIGHGAAHSFTIGATIVTDRAIMPQVPTDVFLFSAGKILSSVKETCVVVMKLFMIPIFRRRISPGMNFSSNLSLSASVSNPIILV